MGSGTFTTESECVDGARIQTAAYGRWDPSLSLMFVVPSQAGTELRRPTESRLRTRQRADRVSLESLETAPTTLNHFIMSSETTDFTE
jgi:hypothetical protein